MDVIFSTRRAANIAEATGAQTKEQLQFSPRMPAAFKHISCLHLTFSRKESTAPKSIGHCSAILTWTFKIEGVRKCLPAHNTVCAVLLEDNLATKRRSIQALAILGRDPTAMESSTVSRHLAPPSVSTRLVNSAQGEGRRGVGGRAAAAAGGA